MRTQIFNLSLILLLVAFGSCSNDDENSSQNETLNGAWHLKNVSGGITGGNPNHSIDYRSGDVMWTFKQSDNILFVVNNIWTTGPEDILSGPETGTYTYEIQENGQTKMLLIENNVWGAIILTNGNFKIVEGASADGNLREFIR